MRLHLELKAEGNRASGMDAEEAHCAARRLFGNATSLKERSRDAWGWSSLDALARDVSYGLRIWCRNPGFMVVAVLTLALQQQAGHASVKMTVDVYGSWFAVEAPGAMDRLAAGAPAIRASGNKIPESGNNPAEAP